jgi:hypothetical protein
MSDVNVGDVVIYVNFDGAEPIKTNVSGVTPTKRIRVDSSPSLLFKQRWRDGEYNAVSRLSRAYVYLYSDAKWAELTAQWEERKKDREEAEEERKQKRREKEEQQVREIEEIKALLGQDYFKEENLSNDVTSVNGSRLYMVHLPVKHEDVLRKGTLQIAIVFCKTSNGDLWEENKGKPIEMVYTYAHDHISSFSSCSPQRFATDEEALWEAARSVYNNSW